MSIDVAPGRDTPSGWELDNARRIYEVLRHHVGRGNSMQAWELASAAQVSEQDVGTAVRWAILEVAPAGVMICSARGPGGGYWIAADRDEERTVATKRIDEDRRRTLRSIATAEAGLFRLRGRARVHQADTIASLKETLRRQERALYEISGGSIAVGSIKEALDAGATP